MSLTQAIDWQGEVMGLRFKERSPTRATRATAFTLVEMLVTVAVLVIVLGLMIGLARSVRERSAQALTKSVLQQLDNLMTQYVSRNRGLAPAVSAFPPADLLPREVTQGGSSDPLQGLALPAEPPKVKPELLAASAQANSRDVTALLRGDSAEARNWLAQQPVSIFDDNQLRDAWGSSIVFMPQKHPWVGTAPRDKAYFFFSAGPDRNYLTRDDNLYSYEKLAIKE